MPMRPGLLLGLVVALLAPGAAVTSRTYALIVSIRTQVDYELQHCTLYRTLRAETPKFTWNGLPSTSERRNLGLVIRKPGFAGPGGALH